MTEQMLIRLAMILQDQAPTTLDKYICKLAEAVLIDFPKGLSFFELGNEINRQFNLSFTSEEINRAISHRSKNRILVNHNICVLAKSARERLQDETSFSTELSEYIVQFLRETNLQYSVEEMSSLLERYFYFCFNSNVDNLLALFALKEIAKDDHSFNATNEEVLVINSFVSWDNPDKDRFIYKIVAICYEYCMLTTKKDSVVSCKIFKGKNFFLDSNIIFRLAGINNEERRVVTQEFINRCKDVGIQLCCTESTVDEVYRVVNSQIDFIDGLLGISAPINCNVLEKLNPSYEITDFYRIYYEWCGMPDNNPGNFVAFRRYLLNLLDEVFQKLHVVSSTAYKISREADAFENQVVNLLNFKNSKKKRQVARNSAETDITNINDLITKRKGGGNSLWQTNYFLVSADQLLITWAAMNIPGVPIVVLPSVWLSIILRFTGRTDDDYKSFCLFLTQRQHFNEDDESIIDPTRLLKTINRKTVDTDVRDQIIDEIVLNPGKYSFKTEDDYENSTEYAFDAVLKQYSELEERKLCEVKADLEKRFDEQEKKYDEQLKFNQEKWERHRADDVEKHALILAQSKAKKKVEFYRAIADRIWILHIMCGVCFLFAIAVCCLNSEAVDPFIKEMLPSWFSNSFDRVWSLVCMAVGILVAGLSKLIDFLGSEKRELKLRNKYFNENKTIMETSQNQDEY